MPHHENQEPRPQYQQRSKSKRELLEERLMQMQLEKELSELWWSMKPNVKRRNWVYHSVVKYKSLNKTLTKKETHYAPTK